MKMNLQYDGFKQIVKGMANNGGICGRSLIYKVRAAAQQNGCKAPSGKVVNGWAQSAAGEGLIQLGDRPLAYVRQQLKLGKGPDGIAADMAMDATDFVRTYWGLLPLAYRKGRAATELMDKIYAGEIADRESMDAYFKRLSRDFRLNKTSLRQLCRFLAPEDWYYDIETNRLLPWPAFKVKG